MVTSAASLGLRSPALRRALTLTLAAALVLILLPAVAARADTPSTLTVVGTSDVQDSGLVSGLITPMFQKAYPQYTLKYVSVGTGVAINDAESGVASAMLVHAASLENQFVAQGFSKEQFGRAIFYGDYVLLGPTSDPAGVLSGAPHDIAAAFARVAAAGAAGKADFVSRGGTPGTTVQEHAIWALDAGTPGLTLCTVSAANGGGSAPSTAGGNCPASPAKPSWYHTTGLTQGPNIESANTCNFANATANGANDCYVITDRGTFACLISAACAGAAAAPTSLKIVTRDNGASARGGSTLLINSFHAYAINPAKFAANSNVQINSTAATDFLRLLTSQSFQAQLKTYLGATSGPPFVADAAPSITAGRLPARVTGGQNVTVSGTIVNAVPGTPPLAGKSVTVSEVGSGLAAGIPIAAATTNSAGAYRITFSPPSTGSYQVATGLITQIENGVLNPVFGDLLQPAAAPASNVIVLGAIPGVSVKALPGRVLVTGSVLPVTHARGSVVLLAAGRRSGPFRKIATTSLGASDHSFALSAPRSKGTSYVKVSFQDPGQVVSTTTKAVKVSVPARGAASVTIKSLKVTNGRFTLTGTIAPKPSRSATTVQVLGLDVGAIPASGGTQAAPTAASGGTSFRVIAKVTLRAGKTRFALHGKLKRGRHWVLELKYAPGGSSSSAYGGLKSVRVT